MKNNTYWFDHSPSKIVCVGYVRTVVHIHIHEYHHWERKSSAWTTSYRSL
jgi:hypothetical protein